MQCPFQVLPGVQYILVRRLRDSPTLSCQGFQGECIHPDFEKALSDQKAALCPRPLFCECAPLSVKQENNFHINTGLGGERKRFVCFAKQELGRARQTFLATMYKPYKPYFSALYRAGQKSGP